MGFCHIKNNCMVVRLPREVDHFQAQRVREECDMTFLRSLVRDIIFDFSGTSFMDSSGIGLILGRIRQVEPVKGRVFLFGQKESIHKMWELAGILDLVTVLNTVEEMKEVYE